MTKLYMKLNTMWFGYFYVIDFIIDKKFRDCQNTSFLKRIRKGNI